MSEHASLSMRRDLTAIAGAWDDLVTRLGERGGPDSSGRRSVPGSRPPISLDVSDVVAEIEEWVVFLARVLLDETDWRTPADTSTPALALAIRERVGHFTEHTDQMLAAGLVEDADRLARLALSWARPSLRRTIRLGQPCHEHGTDTAGRRVVCHGQLTVALRDDGMISDMVCTVDAEHRLTPDQWFRSQRGRGKAAERDVDDLVRQTMTRSTTGGTA
ncbi:MAG: hypothetical protein FWD18_00420 [Micrococcales bacterium]|nr:hypothetical protein [Micrococcales bacterium]